MMQNFGLASGNTSSTIHQFNFLNKVWNEKVFFRRAPFFII